MSLSQISDRRSLALEVWRRQLNQPYIWAGDDPIVGFDCSGLALEGLKAAGIVDRNLDTTAHNLLHVTFKNRPRLTDPKAMRPGCLIFWDGSQGIRHVEIVVLVLQETIFTIGASGGGSKTPTATEAAKQNAYTKIRPAAAGWLCAVDPFMAGSSTGPA
jgi:hypothetical protein